MPTVDSRAVDRFNFEPLRYLDYLLCVVMLGETSILIKRFFFVFTSPPPLMYFCSLHLCANSVTNAIWTLTAAVSAGFHLKVSKFRKQIFLLSFEPKNKQNYFLK